jgi:hypothetical protein
MVFCRLRMSDHTTDETATLIAHEAVGRVHRDAALPRFLMNPISDQWWLTAAAPTTGR